MKPKNVIVWILLLGIIVLLMSTSVQAKDEVNANDILEQIENGEDIYLENVHIVGELDLSEIELKTVPIARRMLTVAIIQSLLKLDLEEELKIVESKIIIKYSVFENCVDFSNTLLRKPLDFQGTSFSSKTDFLGASFSDAADFSGASFSGDANFICANFSGDANFICANFSGDANFRFASFSGDADFSSTSFSGDADFSSTSFSDVAYFSRTRFNKVLFTNTKFTRVWLFEVDFKSMEVQWRSLENALVTAGPMYIKLIKNFREMEQFEDADDAYYYYRFRSLTNLGDVFMWVTCGFGVKPHYTMGLGSVIILVFAIIYWRKDGIRRLKEIEGDDSRMSFWDALYFSIVTFTTVGYGDWYPVDRYRIVATIEGVLGWLLLALFIVTLANVMIRP